MGDASSPVKFILDEMHRRAAASATRIFAPDRGDYHVEAACDLALRRYGGVWGPFVGHPPTEVQSTEQRYGFT